MHAERAPDRPAQLPDPAAQFVAAGVRRVAVDGGDLGGDVVRLAEDADVLLAILDAAAQRALGLESDQQDAVAGGLAMIRQMMGDPAVLRHSGCRDDDCGTVERVELLRFIHVAHVGHEVIVEELRVGPDQRLGVVEEFGVHPEDGGGFHGERRIDVDRDLRNLLRVGELVQRVDQFLGAPQRKRRNQDDALARGDTADDLAEMLRGIG